MKELLFDELLSRTIRDFPDTRYQGSKLKVLDWIWAHIEKFEFYSVLDAFGGTGCLAYLFKTKGKKVAYNDVLRFNYIIGKALVENSTSELTNKDVDYLLSQHKTVKYRSIIADNFLDVYFTDDENHWIDMVVQNIEVLDNDYKKAIALFALFQSCIIKRPYNLFHRKNLYIRLQDVERSFGNKTSWDKPFEQHFRNFVRQANNAIFDNGEKNIALNKDVFHLEANFDLVYIDTPYLNASGVGVDYLGFYHFLEGLSNYDKWNELIDHKYKHRPIKHLKSVWADKKLIYDAFERLFWKFKDSILVVSYRSDGIPSEQELFEMVKNVKSNVMHYKFGKYKYVLSKNHTSEEILIIGY